MFKNFVILKFFENTKFLFNIIFVTINFEFVIKIFFISIDSKTIYSIVVTFNVNFESFETNESLIFNHDNVNREFFREIIYKNNKIFSVNAIIINKKINNIIINKVVAITIKKNMFFVCLFFD